MCGKLDAFACGQLIALSEHRAVLKAKLWDMDPFVRDVGASIRSTRTDNINENLQIIQERLSAPGGSDEEGKNLGMSLSTRTLLVNYANRVREQRVYVVKK